MEMSKEMVYVFVNYSGYLHENNNRLTMLPLAEFLHIVSFHRIPLDFPELSCKIFTRDNPISVSKVTRIRRHNAAFGRIHGGKKA